MRKEYWKHFEQATRTSSQEKFIKLKEDAPPDLGPFIREVHRSFDDALPNDWIFETVLEAFEALDEDKLHNITIEADIYTYQLLEWLNKNNFAIGKCDEVLENYSESFIGIIENAQALCKIEIYDAVNQFIQEEEATNEEV